MQRRIPLLRQPLYVLTRLYSDVHRLTKEMRSMSTKTNGNDNTGRTIKMTKVILQPGQAQISAGSSQQEPDPIA